MPDVTISEPKDEKSHITADGESCMWEQEVTREELGQHTWNFK